MKMIPLAAVIVGICAVNALSAQAREGIQTASAGPKAEAQQAAPPSANPTISAGTVVEIELAEPISSKVAKRGDTFGIRLAEPLVWQGQVVLPAGVTGTGQIVDAAPSGPLGRPAKLLLAARSLDFQGAKLPLRSFRIGRAGSDPTDQIMLASIAVPIVGVFAGFMHGGEIEIPAGAHAHAKLAVDLDASGKPLPAPGVSPQP